MEAAAGEARQVGAFPEGSGAWRAGADPSSRARSVALVRCFRRAGADDGFGPRARGCRVPNGADRAGPAQARTAGPSVRVSARALSLPPWGRGASAGARSDGWAPVGMSSNPHFLSPKNGLVIYPLTSLPAFQSSVDGPGRACESPQL
jgi:hypothetical protein